MKQKTISLLLALALALSLAGCQKEETVTAPAGVAVQVQTVEAQDIASENTVSGQVTADSETSVYVTSTAKCTAVYVQAGDTVKAGTVLCVLEAMKMENEIPAPKDGKVAQVVVTKGATVGAGDTLVVLA